MRADLLSVSYREARALPARALRPPTYLAGNPLIDIAVLEAMVAEGATAATIVRVVKMMVAREEAQRAQWRERKARSRLKPQVVTTTEHLSGHVTVTGQSRDANSAYIEEKKEVKKERKYICKIALPADFELNEADKATCEKAGWDQARIASELQRFKDHAAANGRRQIDWHASWRNWVTSPLQTSPKPNGGTNGHHANPAAIRRTSDAVAETLARRQLDLYR